MGENKKERNRKCFIITPIGDAASETFRMAKGVIESVIKPLLQKNGYDDIKPAYEINQTGMITTQIINRILEDDLVIANLTGNNPNVMYELCLRHVSTKPIIHICQNGTILPFDIKDNRTIFYTNDMLGVKELKEQMEAYIQEIDYTKENLDNPIYNAHRIGKLLKDVPEGIENKVEIELLQSILETLNNSQINKDLTSVQPKSIICIYTIRISGDLENISVARNELEIRMKCFEFEEVSYSEKVTEKGHEANISYRGQIQFYKQLHTVIMRIFKDVSTHYYVEIELV